MLEQFPNKTGLSRHSSSAKTGFTTGFWQPPFAFFFFFFFFFFLLLVRFFSPRPRSISRHQPCENSLSSRCSLAVRLKKSSPIFSKCHFPSISLKCWVHVKTSRERFYSQRRREDAASFFSFVRNWQLTMWKLVGFWSI